MAVRVLEKILDTAILLYMILFGRQIAFSNSFPVTLSATQRLLP